jgi:hypothetical protein
VTGDAPNITPNASRFLVVREPYSESKMPDDFIMADGSEGRNADKVAQRLFAVQFCDRRGNCGAASAYKGTQPALRKGSG